VSSTQPNFIDPIERFDARADALGWASRLTTERHTPLLVIINAEPILQWLAAAADEQDLALRLRAGDLASANDDEREPDDDGAAFVLRAAVLHEAMTRTP
jgi:hypothetical protein